MDGRRVLRDHVTLEVEDRPPLFTLFYLSAFSSMSPRLRGELGFFGGIMLFPL